MRVIRSLMMNAIASIITEPRLLIAGGGGRWCSVRPLISPALRPLHQFLLNHGIVAGLPPCAADRWRQDWEHNTGSFGMDGNLRHDSIHWTELFQAPHETWSVVHSPVVSSLEWDC